MRATVVCAGGGEGFSSSQPGEKVHISLCGGKKKRRPHFFRESSAEGEKGGRGDGFTFLLVRGKEKSIFILWGRGAGEKKKREKAT